MFNCEESEIQRIIDHVDLMSLESHLPYLMNFSIDASQYSNNNQQHLKGVLDLLSLSLEYYSYTNDYLNIGVQAVEREFN